jgi:hypothetical protein
MLEKLISFLKTWNNGALESIIHSIYNHNIHNKTLSEYIHEHINHALIYLYRNKKREFYEYQGLMGFGFTEEETKTSGG